MNLLHVAARRGSELMVRWLIKMGVSVNDQVKFQTSVTICGERNKNSLKWPTNFQL